MKFFAAAAVLAVFSTAPAVAQQAPAAADMAASAKFSIETPIEQLVADPQAKAVLEAEFPGIATHPMYETFKTMSLVQLQPVANGQITDAQIAKAKAELAAIK